MIVGGTISSKESAFMSRELATIVTDIPEIQKLSLYDVKLDLNEDILKQRLLELDIRTLL
ncbi:TPA: hypothetical protein ACF0PM_002251 [Clostridium perfringens]